MSNEGNSLIRVLPACLKEPLPHGWDKTLEGYVIETMPPVDIADAVPLSIQATEPDILLVDGDFPNLDLVSLAKEAHKARPGLAVIVLATDHNQRLLHQAMLAGVEEFLQKPIEGNKLQETLLSVAKHRTLRTAAVNTEQQDATTAHGRIVGIVSGKGGLGRTTIATNLAALVAKSKLNTALIGFESGDGAILLDVQPRLGLFDMISALASREHVDTESTFSVDWMKQYAVPHRCGLHYWTWKGLSPQTTSDVPPQFINVFMESCRAAFAYTFIDFPNLTDEEFAAVLPLLDVVLVISSTSDLLALRSTKNILDQVTPEYRRRVRVIINRADPLDMITNNDFEEALGFKASAALPNQPQIAAGAINMGAPLATTQQPSELSECLQKLSEQLFKISLPQIQQKPVKRFGLF